MNPESIKKAKLMLKRGNLRGAIAGIRPLLKNVTGYSRACPSCGQTSAVVVKNNTEQAKCVRCGAIWGSGSGENLDKISQDAPGAIKMPNPITKQEISDYLSRCASANDGSVTSADVADWNQNGRLRKSVYEKLHAEIGLLPPRAESDDLAKATKKDWDSFVGDMLRGDESHKSGVVRHPERPDRAYVIGGPASHKVLQNIRNSRFLGVNPVRQLEVFRPKIDGHWDSHYEHLPEGQRVPVKVKTYTPQSDYIHHEDAAKLLGTDAHLYHGSSITEIDLPKHLHDSRHLKDKGKKLSKAAAEESPMVIAPIRVKPTVKGPVNIDPNRPPRAILAGVGARPFDRGTPVDVLSVFPHRSGIKGMHSAKVRLPDGSEYHVDDSRRLHLEDPMDKAPAHSKSTVEDSANVPLKEEMEKNIAHDIFNAGVPVALVTAGAIVATDLWQYNGHQIKDTGKKIGNKIKQKATKITSSVKNAASKIGSFNKTSPESQGFVSSEIKHLKTDKGYPQHRAVAAALNIAREKGYKVGGQIKKSDAMTADDHMRLYHEARKASGYVESDRCPEYHWARHHLDRATGIRYRDQHNATFAEPHFEKAERALDRIENLLKTLRQDQPDWSDVRTSFERPAVEAPPEPLKKSVPAPEPVWVKTPGHRGHDLLRKSDGANTIYRISGVHMNADIPLEGPFGAAHLDRLYGIIDHEIHKVAVGLKKSDYYGGGKPEVKVEAREGDLSRDDITSILIDLVKTGEERQYVNHNTVTRFAHFGDIDPYVMGLVYRKAGIFGRANDLLSKQRPHEQMPQIEPLNKTEQARPVELRKNTEALSGQMLGQGWQETLRRKSVTDQNRDILKSIYRPYKQVGSPYTFKDEDDIHHHLKHLNMALVSAYNDNLPEDQNQARHADFVKRLRQDGVAHTEAEGVWHSDGKQHREKTMILHDVSPKQAKHYADAYGQWGHMHVQQGRVQSIQNKPVHKELPSRTGYRLNDESARGWTEVKDRSGRRYKISLNHSFDQLEQ